MPQMKHEAYKENCQDIRATDDVSFKLLGFVPLISGVGILTVVLKGDAGISVAVFLLSLFASAVTLWLFRWELRNVSTCKWLLERRRIWESSGVFDEGAPEAVFKRPNAPELFGREFGKTQAVKAIYTSSIVAWLLLPWSAIEWSASAEPWLCYVGPVHVLLAAFLLVLVAETLEKDVK